MDETPTPPPANVDDYGAVEGFEAVEEVATNGEVVDIAESTAPISSRLTLDPGNPLPSARAFIDRNYTVGDHRTLLHHAGEFFDWSGTHYPPVDDAEIRAGIYTFLEGAVWLTMRRYATHSSIALTTPLPTFVDKHPAWARCEDTVHGTWITLGERLQRTLQQKAQE